MDIMALLLDDDLEVSAPVTGRTRDVRQAEA
jgi:hypothetical protein